MKYMLDTKQKNRIAKTLFLSPIIILEFDSYAAKEYGKIRTDLERKGTPIRWIY